MTAKSLNPTLSAPLKAISNQLNGQSAQTKADIGPVSRAAIGAVALTLSAASLYALLRWATGLAPAHPNMREIAILIHVSTVIPAIPLGGWLMLARKGNALHKRLGKVWMVLMLATAISAIFIQTGGGFSFIHLFVPITLHGIWKAISTARAGNIAAHKGHLVGMYLGALMIPGVLAFMLPGRLMNVLVFGS